MNKHIILMVGVLALATACGNQTDSASQQADVVATNQQAGQSPADSATPPPQATTAGLDTNLLTRELPTGFTLAIPHYVVYDRDIEGDTGMTRRVLVEFLEGDMDSANTRLTQMLEQAGYRKGREVAEQGGIRSNYRSADNSFRLATRVTPASEMERTRSKDAKGSIYMSWVPDPAAAN